MTKYMQPHTYTQTVESIISASATPEYEDFPGVGDVYSATALQKTDFPFPSRYKRQYRC